MLVILLLSIHFSIPLIYHWYLKTRWFNRVWNIKTDESFRPSVAVIVPTYNEGELLEKRLTNIYEQRYPQELIEIIVTDSASTDGTLTAVDNWFKKHSEANLKVIKEVTRKGKASAVSKALKCTSSPVVIIGDADSLWDKNAIRNTVKYFADPSIGALTASLRYCSGKGSDIENNYRRFYNLQRVAESKIHSTPIHSGVLQAIRKELIEEQGLSSYANSEDCAIASYIAFEGYRAIQTDDVWAYEPLRGSHLKTKIRRARHNILNFLLTKK